MNLFIDSIHDINCLHRREEKPYAPKEIEVLILKVMKKMNMKHILELNLCCSSQSRWVLKEGSNVIKAELLTTVLKITNNCLI